MPASAGITRTSPERSTPPGTIERDFHSRLRRSSTATSGWLGRRSSYAGTSTMRRSKALQLGLRGCIRLLAAAAARAKPRASAPAGPAVGLPRAATETPLRRAAAGPLANLPRVAVGRSRTSVRRCVARSSASARSLCAGLSIAGSAALAGSGAGSLAPRNAQALWRDECAVLGEQLHARRERVQAQRALARPARAHEQQRRCRAAPTQAACSGTSDCARAASARNASSTSSYRA